LLVQQVGAQVAAGVVQHAGFHGGFAHALDQFAHEQRFELLGGFLDGLGRVFAGLQLQVAQRLGVYRQALRAAQRRGSEAVAVAHVR
jgi:hypothetical protein